MRRLVVLTTVFVLSLAGVVQAQSTTSALLTGRISDPSKAVISEAKVTVVNTDTNIRYESLTDKVGSYYVANLPPGMYRIEVEKLGFKTVTKPGIILHVQDALEINFEMALGSASESITVQGGAPLVQTESAALGKVTSDEQIVSLPLANRNFTQILALSPGVTVGLPDAGELGKNNQNVSANGAGTTYNSFQFNGIDANNISENSASGYGPEVGLAVPAPDTIQEFKVQTGLYDANSGRGAGANIDIVSKSGTNQFHGDLWEFLRNDAFNANDFFLNRNGQSRPVLKQNQFGLTFGGPIRKNKTFFFLAYQGTIQRNGVSPSLSLQSSLLPSLTNDRSAATLGEQFGGQTGFFGGTAVAPDGSNINPVALALLNFKFSNGRYAIPTPQVTLPSGLGEYTYSAPAHYQENQYTLNIDHTLTSKNQLSGRFFFSAAPQTTTFALYGANLPGWGQNESDKNLMFVASDTHTFSSKLINVARFGFVRFHGARTINEPITNSDVGITSPTGLPGIPSIAVNGLFKIGTPQTPEFVESTNMFDAQDTLFLVVGKHALRMGAEAKRDQLNVFLPYETRGYLSFLSFADFLLGESGSQNGTGISNIYSTSIYSGLFNAAERYIDFSSFFQDDYKISPRLTLNLGLRYDFFGPPSEIDGRLPTFDPRFADPEPPSEGTLTGLVLPSNYTGSLPAGVVLSDTSGLYNRSFRNFEPRFGFAYRLADTPAVVLRGGYGMYYARPSGQYALQVVGGSPFSIGVSRGGADNAQATFQVPVNPSVPPSSSFPMFLPRYQDSSYTYAGIERNLKTPYTQQYSLNLQYEFTPNFLWEIGYVGSRSTHLPSYIAYNQALLASPQNPVHGVTTNTVENLAQRLPILGAGSYSVECRTRLNANYNSLQTSVERRLSHGLTFLASYTFSKKLSYTTGPSNYDSLEMGTLTGDQTNPRQAYGLDSFDRKHRFVSNFVYQPPDFSHGPRPVRSILSNWRFSGVVVFQSGLPITVTDSNAGTIYSPEAFPVEAECTGLSPATSGSVQSRLNGYINPAAFTDAPAIGDGTGFGNCGVGILRGPNQRNLDFSLQRDFPIRERTKLEFRTEFFNLTNTPNFDLPESDRASGSSFGVISSTVSNPRIIQFALKLRL